MPILFLKFFVVIWLALAGAVAIMALVLNHFDTPPFISKLEAEKRGVVLDLTARVLEQDGETAARRLVRTSETSAPVGLTIGPPRPASSCEADSERDIRIAVRDGDCFIITAEQRSAAGLAALAKFVPWVAIVLSSALSAAVLARYLIRPVAHLRDALSALARGRFDTRIGDRMAGRKDEVSTLAHDFDATAARLQELQDAQQKLFHDVSHELRSPLSRLQAVAGVLRQNPAKLGAMLDRMDREVERLDALVGEVLTLARLNAGSGPPLRTQIVDVIDLLNEILTDASFEAEQRGVAITASVTGTFPADIDGELVYRAFENVVRNAVKYTAPNSRVGVACDIEGARLTVRVVDEGPGVAECELERIFQPFSRGDDVETRTGAGLGLTIARQAIERHGGRVRAALPPAGGLAVTLELPRGPVAQDR